MAEVKNGGCGTIRYTQKAHKDVRPEDRLARTMYVIITDGMESASLCCTTDEVRGLVKQQGAEGWEFVFLGANIDAVQVADGLGIRADHAVEFACDAAGVRENFASLSHMTCAFAHTGIVGAGWKTKISEHLAKRQSGRS